MNSEADHFKFNGVVEHLEPKRVEVPLDGLNKEGVVWCNIPFEGVNKLAVNDMSEEDVAKYLNHFLQRLHSGTESIESLSAHTMFNAVMEKAQNKICG